MLLFKPYHVFPIVCGNLPFEMAGMVPKTETRRVWKKPRAKIGSIHLCRLRFDNNYFAKVRIVDVYEQTLGEMTEENARNEGGYTVEEYRRLWKIINGKPLNPLEEVFVVEMECVEINMSSADFMKYGELYQGHMKALGGVA